MANKKSQYVAVTSPVGQAAFAWLDKADTRYNEEGDYKVDLSVPFEEAHDFIDELEAILNEYIDTSLNTAQKRTLNPKAVYIEEFTRPDRDATDEEKAAFEPEPTGNVIFRFKMKRVVHPKNGDSFTQAPEVVDTNGDRITDPVFPGSVLRVRGQAIPYTNAAAGSVGVSLRLKAAQVLELQTGTGGNFWTDFPESE